MNPTSLHPFDPARNSTTRPTERMLAMHRQPIPARSDLACRQPRNRATVCLSGRVDMKNLGAEPLFIAALFLGTCLALPAFADNIFVSTASLNTVLELDPSGNPSTFATTTSGLDYPLGLAFDSSGNLFVANGGANTIEEFHTNGQTSFLSSPSLNEPDGLAFDANGDLFVANYGNNTVEEFSPGGTGTVFATATDGLDEPEGLAFDGDGNLFVSNQGGGNGTIMEISPNGSNSVFATTASGLDNPQGLVFDRSGTLYVANYSNNTIEKFNALGQGMIFTGTNLLAEPYGLGLDGSGNLFVANHGLGEILEFSQNGDGSIFAGNLGNAIFLAVDQIPEPSAFSLLLLSLAVVALSRLSSRRQPHRHP